MLFGINIFLGNFKSNFFEYLILIKLCINNYIYTISSYQSEKAIRFDRVVVDSKPMLV